jgi:hypothetical protein
VRRGASWTVAYHLQLTVAAVARPVGSSVVPSESLLLSGPGLLLTQMTSAGGASSRHPRSGVVALVDTAWTPAMASVAGRCPASGVHPSGIVVPDPAAQPSGVQPSGVRSPGSSGCPAVRSSAVHPSGVQPCRCPPVQRPAGWRPPRRFGRVRLLPCRAVALGPGRCGGHPSPRERVESRWAAAPSSGSSTAGQAWTWAVLPRSPVGQSDVGGGLGPDRVRAAALDR